MKKHILSLLVAIGLIGSSIAQQTSQTFGSGGNTFSLNFQTIGNAGNAADTTGYGAVNYNYSMGTYDISVNQLNAATANGVAGLGNGYWTGDQPAANVSWYQAAAFVNFLNTSTGHQAAYNLTYSGGAYTMTLWATGQAGYDPNNPYRNSLALFVLPSENEFYKAAYGKSDGSGYYLYPTGSDSTPTAVTSGTTAGTAVFDAWMNGVTPQAPASVYQAGGLSPYGTMGQGGNVWQWEESAWDGNNDVSHEARGIGSGDWNGYGPEPLQSSLRGSSLPVYGNGAIGFRVARKP
jgi:formylglycine-generating enzyme required for sulfatase activity